MSSKSPAAKSRKASGAKAAPGKSTGHPVPRILLVDCDPALRVRCSEVLTGSGYRVDTAGAGAAGWRLLHAASRAPDGYDLLIADNRLPKLSGVELIKKARAQSMTLPVILASGTAPADREWFQFIGPLQLASILPKPFSADELVQMVKEVLHWSTSQHGQSA